MGKMTKEQREFKKGLEEAFPELKELDRLKPIYVSSNSFFKNRLIGKIEEYLNNHATLLRKESEVSERLKNLAKSGLRDKLAESGGQLILTHREIYGAGEKEKIVYEKIDAISHYFAHMIFIGFDTKDSKYIKLRRGFHDAVRSFGKLEAKMIEKHGNPAEILKGFE